MAGRKHYRTAETPDRESRGKRGPERVPSLGRRLALDAAAISASLLVLIVAVCVWTLAKNGGPWGTFFELVFVVVRELWWYFPALIGAVWIATLVDRLDRRIEPWRTARRERREDARAPGFASAAEEIAALRDALQHLSTRPLAFRSEREAWRARVVATRRMIRRFRHAPPVPGFVHQWLADAEEQADDPAGAALQAARLERVLGRLRAGAMPTDEETRVDGPPHG